MAKKKKGVSKKTVLAKQVTKRVSDTAEQFPRNCSSLIFYRSFVFKAIEFLFLFLFLSVIIRLNGWELEQVHRRPKESRTNIAFETFLSRNSPDRSVIRLCERTSGPQTRSSASSFVFLLSSRHIHQCTHSIHLIINHKTSTEFTQIIVPSCSLELNEFTYSS